uniref:NADH-ubiquinone oxidoreductase chain 6 n=2 Tax=Mogera TaxID=62294 RepID=A0A142I0R5_9EUTH|nr:NADH dehydrogenase subunit 6 [Mogera wogura]YP_009243317.1 NADH dehydrogenase subunit 6 [Mogera robusta]AMR35697.1 NADH dehydrogenase subunit 6 [Mogera robusta]QID76685.1 NADH dehydrogenase subunit 6 [Mogera robusta]BAC78872.1 NADH dehydrogenase subunit 6 [Mogera wogura]
MMTYIVFILSTILVVSFVGFSSKPSPIYGGLGLIVGGGVGCGIVLNYGGSFLGLMVFLIYLGGMLVVFGYTTAMAMEEYPEVWVSNKTVLSLFVLGMLTELLFVGYCISDEKLEIVLNFNGQGDWVIYDTGDSGFFSEEAMGIAALYSYGTWLVIVTGWSLVIGVLVVMEITRGN